MKVFNTLEYYKNKCKDKKINKKQIEGLNCIYRELVKRFEDIEEFKIMLDAYIDLAEEECLV